MPVVLAATASLAACTAPADSGPPEDSSSGSPSSVEEAAVLETYQEARAVYIDLLRGETDLDTASTELEAYSSGQAYDSLVQDGQTFGDAGIVFEGEPGMDPQVTGMDLETTPPTAVLTDCWDTADWQPVRDGVPLEAAPDQEQRRVINVRAEKPDDHWVLTELTPEEGRTC
ncbi:hypothetical protein MRI28_17500 [Nocardiopsis dassonvillei]|uniref:hypothetical protein n=1 Tax=Nocardiopsis dassonvillei TaxID=2014 RepID=UPI00200DF64E|nr:hypothetical protein [Nocardiopsis dassonvillei]MCK9871412.1 hypothetical protein [Nocardiopsis dassonvillei]